MRIRRTVFGLGIFLFGVGIAMAAAEPASSVRFGRTFLAALVSFLAASILLGWSWKD